MYHKLASEGVVNGCKFYDLKVRPALDNLTIAVKTDRGFDMAFTHTEIEALYLYSKEIQQSK